MLQSAILFIYSWCVSSYSKSIAKQNKATTFSCDVITIVQVLFPINIMYGCNDKWLKPVDFQVSIGHHFSVVVEGVSLFSVIHVPPKLNIYTFDPSTVHKDLIITIKLEV